MLASTKSRTTAPQYDLIVVGGGIQGVLVALQSAARGLRPLLLESRDFGHATSWSSLRIIHGGVRHLSTGDWRKARTSIRQRAWFANQFPDLTEPLPCLLPLYDRGWRRVAAVRWALLANDGLTRFWTRHLQTDRRLPRSRILSVTSTRKRLPHTPLYSGAHPLCGGALWFDLLLSNPPRLMMELVRWARNQGADCLNYATATRLITDRGRVQGIEWYDGIRGEQRAAAAPVVVHCAGPSANWIASNPPLPTRSWMLAFNVLLHRPAPTASALAVTPAAGEPTYFIVPRYGRLAAGTAYYPSSVGPSPMRVSPSEEQVAGFLAQLNSTGAFDGLTLYDVAQVQAGLLPTEMDGTELAHQPSITVHTQSAGYAGLVSVIGTKYTTAREVAERTLCRLWPRRTPRLVPTTPAEVGPVNLQRWIEPTDRQLPAWVDGLEQIIERESVCCWEDLILRRTDWSQQVDDWRGLSDRLVQIGVRAGRTINLPWHIPVG